MSPGLSCCISLFMKREKKEEQNTMNLCKYIDMKGSAWRYKG